MKKLFLVLVLVTATLCSAYSQNGHSDMTFAGKSHFFVTMNGAQVGETDIPSDTLIYASGDFILPAMTYGKMVIPSFQIKGTKYSGGYNGVIWDDQTFSATAVDASGEEKTVTGSSLKGSMTHENGIYRLVLDVTFTYGSMPFPITYSIESYYIKEYVGENIVNVGGQFGPYKASVTHRIRTYVEESITKLDVEIPAYTLLNTAIGDLTLGSYTVCGLEYDEERGGYFRDYSSDNLSMHFTASQNGIVSIDGNYPLSAPGNNNLLVEITNGKVRITNNFKPGAMPFPITAVMDQTASSGISSIHSSPSSTPSFTLEGIKTPSYYRGIVVRNGKKYSLR